MSEDQVKGLKLWLGEKFNANEKQHQEINDHLKRLNGSVRTNTDWRLQFTGGFAVIKWLLGFVGIGNIIILFKLFT